MTRATMLTAAITTRPRTNVVRVSGGGGGGGDGGGGLVSGGDGGGAERWRGPQSLQSVPSEQCGAGGGIQIRGRHRRSCHQSQTAPDPGPPS